MTYFRNLRSRAAARRRETNVQLRRLRRRTTAAQVTAGVATVLALSGGTAWAATAYLVSSNSQVGPNTIAGHHAPTGASPNLIAGSVNRTDLAAADPWHNVVQPSTTSIGCDPNPGVFCNAYTQDITNTYPTGEVSWANAGGNFAPAAYTRDVTGAVHLRGLVSASVGGFPTVSEIFSLPPGYRPTHELVFTSVWNNQNGSYLQRIDVMTDGEVTVNSSGGYQFVSLDGISFLPGE